jgi:hypothetical protein
VAGSRGIGAGLGRYNISDAGVLVEEERTMNDQGGLVSKEYEALNAHLRENIRQFVNWFSFFLTAR